MAPRTTSKVSVNGVKNPTNDAEALIIQPFVVDVTIQGTADLLFHRYSVESVDEKAAAARGSEAKKTDDVESYVYRDQNNNICMPNRYPQRAMQEAARFQQDPRSARKTMFDLAKAGFVISPTLTPMIPANNDSPTQVWDYMDRQRVVVMRSAITRSRPAFHEGWTCSFTIESLLPEYMTPKVLRRLLDDAGRFQGLADFRPTYGRFTIVSWKVRPVGDPIEIMRGDPDEED